MANASQLRILKWGVRAWNVWRAMYRHVTLDLSGAILNGADLRNADLRGANLRSVSFAKANLAGADLSGADLSDANLIRADLHQAHLRGADLLGADLSDADLSQAHLRQANLKGANLTQARLVDADLREADLTEANLTRADLDEADLGGAKLRYARLIEADLWKANLAKADLSSTILHGADLSEANLGQADLRYAQLREANLRGAFLHGAHIRLVDRFEMNLMEADLSGVDLPGADLRGFNLHAAQLRGADLSRAFLDDTDLSAADLRGANLENAHFEGADLTGADLRWAHLEGADLRRAKLNGARYLPGDLISSILRDPKPPPSPGTVAAIDPSDRVIIYNSVSGARTIIEPTLNEIQRSPSDEVSFTAIYPKEGSVETWHTLLVYAHLMSALEAVRQDARRFQDQFPQPKEVTSSSVSRIARGTELTIVPYCEGLVFNPQRVRLQWLEDYHRADFRFRAEPSLKDDAARGEINIYAGPILVGSLKLALLFSEKDAAVARQREEHTRMYRQEDIFISYSHKDTEIILACKKAYEALGFNVLIDRDTLRSGQVWNERLRYMIDTATIFQLFWSQNSCQSEYCRQEWQHALKREKDGFIRPVYWETPMPDPPAELSKYHFEYMQV